MMLIRRYILPILLGLGLSGAVMADELLIIVARNVSENYLPKKKIANIFLREQLINHQGERWIPVNLEPDNPVRIAFSEYFFDKRPEEMDNFWNIKYFQGIRPPYVVKSQQSMLRFVASTPNAIGYVLPCYVDEHVKVVFKVKIKKPKGFSDLCNDK